jgi:hypothetical protein
LNLAQECAARDGGRLVCAFDVVDQYASSAHIRRITRTDVAHVSRQSFVVAGVEHVHSPKLRHHRA